MLTISCIPCNFCAINIINRKKGGGRCYRWVFQPPSIGHSLRYISVSFLVCTCILLLAAVRAGDVAGSSLAAHLWLCAGRWGSASALTSRDHLIDWTIAFRRCGCSSRKNVRAQLISEQIASAREFRAGKPSSSEQCSSTFEFEQSSRLLT